MLDAAVRAAIDSVFEDVAGQVHRRQSLFMREFGRYWRGGATHRRIPANGIHCVPDRVTELVEGEWLDWVAFGIVLPPAMPLLLRVDVLGATQGYRILGQCADGEQILERVDARGHGWTTEETWSVRIDAPTAAKRLPLPFADPPSGRLAELSISRWRQVVRFCRRVCRRAIRSLPWIGRRMGS